MKIPESIACIKHQTGGNLEPTKWRWSRDKRSDIMLHGRNSFAHETFNVCYRNVCHGLQIVCFLFLRFYSVIFGSFCLFRVRFGALFFSAHTVRLPFCLRLCFGHYVIHTSTDYMYVFNTLMWIPKRILSIWRGQMCDFPCVLFGPLRRWLDEIRENDIEICFIQRNGSYLAHSEWQEDRAKSVWNLLFFLHLQLTNVRKIGCFPVIASIYICVYIYIDLVAQFCWMNMSAHMWLFDGFFRNCVRVLFDFCYPIDILPKKAMQTSCRNQSDKIWRYQRNVVR